MEKVIRHKNLSLIFSVVVMLGVSLSSFHFHSDTYLGNSHAEHQITKDHYHCLICGSIFKFSPADGSQYTYHAAVNAFYFTPATAVAASPYNRFQEGRSPPFFS